MDLEAVRAARIAGPTVVSDDEEENCQRWTWPMWVIQVTRDLISLTSASGWGKSTSLWVDILSLAKTLTTDE